MQEAVPPGEGRVAAILGLDADAVAALCAEAVTRDRRRLEPVTSSSTAVGRDAGGQDRGLRVRSEAQRLLRALEAQASEGHAEPVVGLLEGAARDHELRRQVAAHADALRALAGEQAHHDRARRSHGPPGPLSRPGSAFPVSTTLRPRYVPQCGHARWRRVGSPHCGQAITCGAVRASCARRLSRLLAEVRRLGTAMPSSSSAPRHFPRIVSSTARRGSGGAAGQPQAPAFRFAPQRGQRPRHDSPHSGRVGSARMICSCTRGVRSIRRPRSS